MYIYILFYHCITDIHCLLFAYSGLSVCFKIKLNWTMCRRASNNSSRVSVSKNGKMEAVHGLLKQRRQSLCLSETWYMQQGRGEKYRGRNASRGIGERWHLECILQQNDGNINERTKFMFCSRFLANVNVLRYVCYMLSAVRLSSVCLSVVCDVGAPYSGGWTFRQFFSPYDSTGTLLFWCQKSLVGDAPFPLKFAFKVTHPLANSEISTNIGS